MRITEVSSLISDFQEIIPVTQVFWLKRETKWLETSPNGDSVITLFRAPGADTPMAFG